MTLKWVMTDNNWHRH